MYSTYTNFRKIVGAAAAVACLTFSASSFAQGKPGPLNTLDTALAVNATVTDEQGDGEFLYLYVAVSECLDDEEFAAVAGILTGEDRYTLFAPTNAAFRALQGVLAPGADPDPSLTCAVDGLLGEGTLFAVLQYHLVEGRRFSNSVFNRNSVKTVETILEPYTIMTMVDEGTPLIFDGAGQTIGLAEVNFEEGPAPLFNVRTSNGVIHTIDTVMLPQ